MNHSCTEAVEADNSTPASIRRFMQQAIDHYPQLAAFGFTLTVPVSHWTDLLREFQLRLTLRLHAFADQRQSQGKPAPLTQVRILSGSSGNGSIRVVLLLNQCTFYSPRHDDSLQCAQESMTTLISETVGLVTGSELSPAVITRLSVERAVPGTFAAQSDHLSALIRQLSG